MPLKDIQKYTILRSQGDSTMEARMDLLIEHKSQLESQISQLNDHLEKLNNKIQYYAHAINVLNT